VFSTEGAQVEEWYLRRPGSSPAGDKMFLTSERGRNRNQIGSEGKRQEKEEQEE